MKMYDMIGTYNGKELERVTFESDLDILKEGGYRKGILIELWYQDMTKDIVRFEDKDGYEALLFDRRSASVCRAYMKRFGWKVRRR